ncbi:MAG TPA: anti-sigma factor [Steroidobacteraceae bacterium]
MNYEQAEVLDRLAAEYALGTLRGRARRRFERLCSQSAAARRALHRWEDRWTQLSSRLPPVQPAARVWRNVSRQLFGESFAAPRAARRRGWRLAAAAGLVAVALIVGLIVRELAPPPLLAFAVLGTDSTHPVWRLERRTPLTALTIEVVGAVPPATGKSYELWALPRGGAPVSLGLLPAGGHAERKLSEPQRAALLAADKVAVSVEPLGGSPTGSPTGPIVIVTNVAASG